MSTKSPSSVQATQKLEDQLKCPICLDQFIDPRTLPCLHSFCIECLKGLPLDPKGDSEHSLSCPTCRSSFDVPQQGVASFQKAFLINNLIEVHDLMKKVSGEEKSLCDNCLEKGATKYCAECDMFFCHSCCDVHKKWRRTSDHQLLSIAEVASKTTQMVQLKPEPVITCSSHNKPLEIYCVTCEQPICHHCIIKSHKGHDHDLISDVYEEGKEEVEKRLEFLNEKIGKLSRNRECLLEKKLKVQEMGERVKATLQEFHEKFVQALEKARETGMQTVDSSVQRVLSYEEEQIEAVQVHLEMLEACKEHTEHNLQLNTPTQLLVTKQQLMARMESLLKSKECTLKRPTKLYNTFNRGNNEEENTGNQSEDDEEADAKSSEKPDETSESQSEDYEEEERDYEEEEEDSEEEEEDYEEGKREDDNLLVPPTEKGDVVSECTEEEKVKLCSDKQEDLMSVEMHDIINDLKRMFISPFQYPKQIYKQCELVQDFPNSVEVNENSKAKFWLMFQGQPILIDKNEITCEFWKGEDIILCKVDYVVNDHKVTYEVTFCIEEPGNYFFIFLLGKVLIDTKQNHMKVHKVYRGESPEEVREVGGNEAQDFDDQHYLLQTVPQGLPPVMPQRMTQGVSQALPQVMPQGVTQGVSQDLPRIMPLQPGCMTQGVSQVMPQGVSQGLPRVMPIGYIPRNYRRYIS